MVDGLFVLYSTVTVKITFYPYINRCHFLYANLTDNCFCVYSCSVVLRYLDA